VEVVQKEANQVVAREKFARAGEGNQGEKVKRRSSSLKETLFATFGEFSRSTEQRI
jgi:hypothetical protein